MSIKPWIMTLRTLLKAVRSCVIELSVNAPTSEGARHGLFAAPDTDPVTL